jgi:hypothetical protein
MMRNKVRQSDKLESAYHCQTAQALLDVNARNAYIVGMDSMQYTIRGILPWMDERLRAKAKRERKSLNAVAVEILMRGLNPDNPEPEYHDMDDLIGSWVHDPATDEALASMNTIDEELWR